MVKSDIRFPLIFRGRNVSNDVNFYWKSSTSNPHV